MGDDLVDDWWVKEDLDEEVEGNDDKEDNKNKKKKKKKTKVTRTSDINKNNVENNDENKNIDSKKEKKERKEKKEKPVENEATENGTESTVKKKKKRKKEKLDNLDEEVTKPAPKKRKRKKKKMENEEGLEPSLEALWKFFLEELQKSLSSIEIQDIKPENDDWYLKESDTFDRENPKQFPLYLKNIAPAWETNCAALSKKETKGGPIMLILTSSAQRAVDLLRHASPFKGEECKTVKLFAKHFKVEDHVKYLNDNVVHLAVGTPHRVLDLIDNGSLKIKKLKYLIVDWSWKDVKMRGITNMPTVKDDFVLLFQKFIFSLCQKGTLSVGLF